MNQIDERAGLPSASGVERILLCHGSWLLEKDLPEETSADAERGIRIHEANETGDTSGLTLSEADVSRRCLEIEQELFKVWAAEYVQAQRDPFNPHPIREKRLWIVRRGVHLASAKIDYYVVAGTHALILDTKSGRAKQTPPASNWQLRTGAIAIALNYPGIRHVRVGIVQPLGAKSPVCDYNEHDILNSEALLFAGLRDANKPDARRVPGLKQCQFCKAKHICPEAKAAVLAMRPAGVDFAARWELMLPPEKVRLFEACKLADAISKKIKDRIKQDLVDDPASIPGLVKLPDQNVRAISDPFSFYAALLDDKAFIHLGEPDLIAAFTKICEVGFGDAVTLLRELGGKSQKEAEKFLAPFTTTKPRSGKVERVES